MDDKEKQKLIKEEGLGLVIEDNGETMVYEKNEKDKRYLFLFILFFLLISIGSLSYVAINYKGYENKQVNPKTHNYLDGHEINIDLNGDGKCDINCDTNNDGIPDINIDLDDNKIATFNVDYNGDNIPDFNLMNQKDDEGKCILNCDLNNNGFPDSEIDIDGDGICDLVCSKKEEPKEDDSKKDEPKKDDNKKNDDSKPSDDSKKEDEPKKDDDKKDEPKKEEETIIDGDDDDETTYYISLGDDITLDANKIEPGWTGSQSFTIKNTNKIDISYKLEWVNVYNNFTQTNNLYYNLLRNGETILTNQRTPYANSILINNQVVKANSENKYIINYEFKETGIAQNEDQNKTFRANVKLTVK